MSIVVSCRRDRSRVTHGGSPAARASAPRQTSPPTMQIPVRTVRTSRSPTPGTATAAAPAQDERRHQQQGDVLGGGLAGGRVARREHTAS